MDPVIAQIISCSCGAIVKAAALEDNTRDQLFSMYQNEWWQQLETALKTTEQWSMQRLFLNQKQEKQDWKTVTELQRLLTSTSNQVVQDHILAQLEHQQARERINMTESARIHMPQHLKNSTIKEMEQETRWDAFGKPQLLGRNIFGERFASIHTPLRFIHQRTATQIYNELKPRLRATAKAREIRRIQHLNEHKYSIVR